MLSSITSFKILPHTGMKVLHSSCEMDQAEYVVVVASRRTEVRCWLVHVVPQLNMYNK